MPTVIDCVAAIDGRRAQRDRLAVEDLTDKELASRQVDLSGAKHLADEVIRPWRWRMSVIVLTFGTAA